MKALKIIFITLFAVLLAGTGVLLFALPQEHFSENENRMLQTLPAPTGESLLAGEWQAKFGDFTADQLPLREKAVGLVSRIRYALGARDLGGAWIGENGRLYEKVTDADLNGELYEKNLALLRDYAAASGLPTTVMLLPSAADVYPEALPPRATPYDAAALRQQVAERLDGSCSLLDLTDDFAAAKAKNNLYYLTDHHWTAAAAAIAAGCFAESRGYALTDGYDRTETVSESFFGTLQSKVLLPGLTPDRIERPASTPDVSIIADGKEIGLYDESALTGKDKYAYFLGGNHGLVEITTGRAGGTLLILKDSFANSFVPALLAGDPPYARILLVDLRYYKGSMKTILADEGVTELLLLYELSNFAADPAFIHLAF